MQSAFSVLLQHVGEHASVRAGLRLAARRMLQQVPTMSTLSAGMLLQPAEPQSQARMPPAAMCSRTTPSARAP